MIIAFLMCLVTRMQRSRYSQLLIRMQSRKMGRCFVAIKNPSHIYVNSEQFVTAYSKFNEGNNSTVATVL
jgi:hypothetical protein